MPKDRDRASAGGRKEGPGNALLGLVEYRVSAPGEDGDAPVKGREDQAGPGNALLGLVDYHVQAPSEDFDALVEGAEDGALSLLDRPMSPPRRRLSDRIVVASLIVSALFHLALVLLLPRSERLYQQFIAEHRPPKEDIPPVYLYPYLPHDKQEPPASARPPLSDKSRRAHGGEGQPADKPGSQGNTPEPRFEPPQGRSEAAPQPGGQKGGAAAVPAPSNSEESRAAEAAARNAAAAGADAVLQLPKPGEGEGQRTLKGLAGLSGPGGAGLAPSRRGGRVDMGPLSFDTQWYDWGPYAAEMLRRIKYHWRIPEIAMLGVTGVTRIHFFIEKNGTVDGLEILMEAEHPPMTFAARDAILDASPLPPLPSDLGSQREGVTITFYYNTPVPGEDQGN